MSFNKHLRILTEHLFSLVLFLISSGFKSSRSQMFFKIVTLNILEYSQENACVDLKTCKLLKTLVNIAKCLRIAFLKNTSESVNHIGSCFFEFQVKNYRTVE